MHSEAGKQMSKEDIRRFFDERAPEWDENTIRNEEVIVKILDNAGIMKGSEVLDVACGTGALFADYIKREVSHVTAIDLSPEMIRIARENYKDPRLKIICGDIEVYEPGRKYDVCMLYNAFPHFPQPELLIRVLSGMLRPGGRLSIAHGMSAEQLKEHHSGEALKHSRNLPDTDELAKVMSRYIEVDCQVSDDTMYQVAGYKR